MLDSQLHEDHILRYSVSIEDSPDTADQMAVVTFYDENNKKVTRLKLNVIAKETVYKWLDNGTQINLKHAYVKDLSLSEYRELKGKDKEDYILIQDLNAEHTFFDCEASTDFSYSKFEGRSTVFNRCVFGNGNANFSYSDFGHGDVYFTHAKFGGGTTNFKSVKFGDGHISFTGTNFGNGNLSTIANFGTNPSFSHTYTNSSGSNVTYKPKVNIIKSNNDYRVVFRKTGEYKLRFYDMRKEPKVLFVKNIMVNALPDPIVKIKGDNLNNYAISVKDLISAERLEAKLQINNLSFFPGRINSYKVIRIHNGKEEESVINYGELFQSPTQKVMGALVKNDLIIFDNLNMSLIDGSTRIAAPIVYKITN